MSPRELVDKLLDARKKKNRQDRTSTNIVGNTYSVLPATHASSFALRPIDVQTPEKDINNTQSAQLRSSHDENPNNSTLTPKHSEENETLQKTQTEEIRSQTISTKDHQEAESEFFVSKLHRDTTGYLQH